MRGSQDHQPQLQDELPALGCGAESHSLQEVFLDDLYSQHVTPWVVISWLTWLSLTSEAPEDNLVPGGLPRMLDSCMAQCWGPDSGY